MTIKNQNHIRLIDRSLKRDLERINLELPIIKEDYNDEVLLNIHKRDKTEIEYLLNNIKTVISNFKKS